MIEGQRQKSNSNRKRRRKPKSEVKAKVDPVLIVARRPDSPLMLKVSNRNIAASGRPKKTSGVFHALPGLDDAQSEFDAAGALGAEQSEGVRSEVNTDAASDGASRGAERTRRVARVAQQVDNFVDDLELKRQRLLERLVASEGRGAISKLADELAHHNWECPEEQAVQIQLLEHVDERRASAAIDVMTRLLSTQPPIKRPILDQRLRRLEEGADDQEVRRKAAALRRTLRVA